MSTGEKRKKSMQSKKLQYERPDENLKGGKNKGIIGQYPFFAPDTNYLKKAPKMTRADELYLKKFMMAREHGDVARIEDGVIGDKQRQKDKPDIKDPFDNGKINIEINVNQRLYLERNRHLKPDQVQYNAATGEKVSLTNAIFGEKDYNKLHEDTTKIEAGDWQSSAFDGGKPKQRTMHMPQHRRVADRVVPFFPTDWKLNANDVFNLILNGEEGTENVYDEVSHAAIHRKGFGQDSVSPMLGKMAATSQDRPTSGKHYAREFKPSKLKRSLSPPNHDPLTSTVARNFETSKKVEGLLNRLADYMAGEIPDTGDLDEVFGKKPEPAEQPNDNTTFDDATTAFTKADERIPMSKEPVMPAKSSREPPMTIEADEDAVEIEEDETPRTPTADLPEIVEETARNIEGLDSDRLLLPYLQRNQNLQSSANRRFRSPPKKEVKKIKPDNLFIYKDFDTSLTKVKSHIKKMPLIDQTTSQRGEDMIRDRLLSFNVRDGSLSTFDRKSIRNPTINERTQALQQRQMAEQIMKNEKQKPGKSTNMRHKAFWVQNQSQTILPDICDSRNQTLSPLRGKHGREDEQALAQSMQTLDPLPIQKNEKVISVEKQDGGMNLVQQYVMIRGRLQPALKYIAPIPMFNRYSVKNPGKKKFQEIVTYPTVSGDLKMKNKHVGVNFDDRDIPQKSLPTEKVEGPKKSDLEGVVKTLQTKNIQYNHKYYSQVQRRDMRAVDDDEIDDPRSLAEIEQENLDLKEMFIHQMVTLESYHNVAVLWQADQEGSLNPFETSISQDFESLKDDINKQDDIVNDDGWVDYGEDRTKNFDKEVDDQRHGEKFDPDAFQKSMQVVTVEDVDLVKTNNKPRQNFVIPKQVASIGSKIKSLFIRKGRSKSTYNAAAVASQSQSQFMTRTHHRQTQSKNFGSGSVNHQLHYGGNFEYQRQLQGEVDQLRDLLNADFKNQRIVDLENKIRDNKRVIVNTMSENIFNLRFGHQDNKRTVKQIDRDELLLRMLQSRMKRIRMVDLLIKESNDRKTQLMTWGLHSDLIDYRRQVKVTQDIVILLQEKNLLSELQGSKKFIRVGDIERQMDWPIRVRNQFGPIDSKDYYQNKLRTEIDQHNALLNQITRDLGTGNIMAGEMKAFISAVFGNDGWIKLVQARWLRNNQGQHQYEYDPYDVKVYVKPHATRVHVPRHIVDELPTHGTDQFGSFHARSGIAEAQVASRLTSENLMTRRYPVKAGVTKRQTVPGSLGRRALRGKQAAEASLTNSARMLGGASLPKQMRNNPQADYMDRNQLGRLNRSEDQIQLIKQDPNSQTNGSGIFNNAGFIMDMGASFQAQSERDIARMGTAQDLPMDPRMNSDGILNGIQLNTAAGLRILEGDGLREVGPAEEDDEHKLMTQIVKDELAEKKTKLIELAEQDIAVMNGTVKDVVSNKDGKDGQTREGDAGSARTVGSAAEGEGKNQEGEEQKDVHAPTDWLARIRKEQLERETRANREKEERRKRLADLLDSDSEDNEDNFDYKGLVGDNLTNFLSRIENHVMAEQKILDAWHDKDEEKKK